MKTGSCPQRAESGAVRQKNLGPDLGQSQQYLAAVGLRTECCAFAAYMHTYAHIYTHAHMHTYTHMHIYTHIYMHINVKRERVSQTDIWMDRWTQTGRDRGVGRKKERRKRRKAQGRIKNCRLETK